jgi:hypothetical protein
MRSLAGFSVAGRRGEIYPHFGGYSVMIAGSATRPNRFVAIISLEFTKAPRRSNVGRFYDRSQTQLWRWTGFLPWQEWDSAVERIAYG